MKNLKNILLAGFVSVCFLSPAAYAGKILNLRAGEQYIHATFARINQDAMDTNIRLYIGQGDKNVCKNTKLIVNETFSLSDGDGVGVDGDLLAQAVGIGYGCAKEVYTPQKSGAKPATAQYTLINDGSTYTDSDPNEQWVELR